MKILIGPKILVLEWIEIPLLGFKVPARNNQICPKIISDIFQMVPKQIFPKSISDIFQMVPQQKQSNYTSDFFQMVPRQGLLAWGLTRPLIFSDIF